MDTTITTESPLITQVEHLISVGLVNTVVALGLQFPSSYLTDVSRLIFFCT